MQKGNKKTLKPRCLFFEHVKAAAGVAAHQDVPAGMNHVNGTDGPKAVGVVEGVQQFPRVLVDLDLPRLRHAAHHEAVLLLRVPYRSEPRQPAARVIVVSSEQQTGRKKREKHSSD